MRSAAASPPAADEDDTEELTSSYSRGRPKRSRTSAAAASIESNNNNNSDEVSGGASRNTAPRTASAAKTKKVQNYRDKQNRRERCGTCPGCLRDDCGTCYRCLGKVKFGGDGKIGRICAQRRCHVLYPQQKRKEEREAEMAAASRRVRADEQQGEEDDDEDNDDGNSSNSSSSSGSFAAAARRTTSRSKRRKRSESNRGSRSRKARSNKEDSSLQSDSTPIEDATNVFTVTKYLAKQEESANAQMEEDKRKPPPRATTLYGLPIPAESPSNLCAGCQGERDDELEDQPVLLCDGQNCGREYHLQCCVPQLSCVPKDTDQWLCQDCSPEGSTASLVKYLESMDQARTDFFQNLSADVVDPENEFIRRLLRQDSQEIGLPDDCRFPESEMERSAMTHSLALCDSKALTRTRGGSESNREPLPPDTYLGKPIRIYNSAGNQYHAGRIVDYRTRRSPHVPLSGNPMRDTEFLVRFAAGSGDRKRSHQHWILLEEHALAVGTTLVWGQIPAGSWKPAILWLRTARDLVPVQNLLNESEGEIHYVSGSSDVGGAAAAAAEPSKQQLQQQVWSPSRTKHKVFSLARTFGEFETFALINVRDQSVDLFHQETMDKHLHNKKNDSQFLLPFQMAKMEHEVQQRVRAWRALPQENPVGPRVLSSRDSHTLPSLVPANKPPTSQIGSTHAELCPSIARGLDRAKILQLLQRRGCTVEQTKDVAASLSCELLPVNAQTIQAERLGRNFS